jgi:hypothetical protein
MLMAIPRTGLVSFQSPLTSWQTLVDDLNTWLAANEVEIVDAWAEQTTSQRQGLDMTVLYVMYRTLADNVSLTYEAYSSSDPTQDFTDFFAESLDDNYGTRLPVIVVPVVTTQRGDAEKFNQMFYIALAKDDHPNAMDTSVPVFIAEALGPVAAQASAVMDLYNSRGLYVAQREVKNISNTVAWPAGDRNYVVRDPRSDLAAGTAVYMGIPSGCP